MKTRNVRRRQRIAYARHYGVRRQRNLRNPGGFAYMILGDWCAMPPSVVAEVWFA